jgi:MFS family permease
MTLPFWKKMFGQEKSVPVLLELRSHKAFILTVVCFAIFTDIFLYSIIIPVLPFALENRMGISSSHVQYWTSILLAIYGAALIFGSIFFGWLADWTTSRQLPLILGLVALGASTVFLCVAKSIALFAVGRVLQGISSAVIWSVGCALLVDTVGKGEVGQAMGYVGLAMSLATLMGPLLGGVVYAHGGYYSVFAMAFGIVAMDIVLRLIMIEKKRAILYLEDSPFDEEEDVPETETTQQSKMPPMITLLSSLRLDAALFTMLITALVMGAFEATIPLRTNTIWGWNSESSGVLFLAGAVPSFISPLIGYFSERLGGRWFAVFGLLGFMMPALVLLRFVDHNDLRQKVLLAALIALVGAGLASVLTPCMTDGAMMVAERERKHPGVFGKRGAYAQLYALFNMAWAAGALAGPLWGGFVLEKAGWSTMGWSLGLACGVTSIIAVSHAVSSGLEPELTLDLRDCLLMVLFIVKRKRSRIALNPRRLQKMKRRMHLLDEFFYPSYIGRSNLHNAYIHIRY